MESTDSSSESQQPHLPPGFRFHPTDEELVVHYLKKKASSSPLPVTIIAEVDLYKFDPWELPGKATFGEHEWYFFSPRDRKYPNGARPNRAATSGYWKATGTDKPILTSGGNQKVGVKKALVFYGGKPPKGIKTNWIMHEYRLIENTKSSKPPVRDLAGKKNSLRLDDWVLCRIYKKNNSQRIVEREKEDYMEDMIPPFTNSTSYENQMNQKIESQRRTNYGALMEREENFFEGLLCDAAINGSSISQLPSSSTKPELSRAQATTSSSLPLKRTITSQYWNDNNVSSSSNTLDGSTPITALHNQLPQISHQQIFGSLGDGVFRQPYQLSSLNGAPNSIILGWYDTSSSISINKG